MTQPPENTENQGIPPEGTAEIERASFCMMCGTALAGAASEGTPRGFCADCAARRDEGRRLCPFCRETVLAKVERCPFCDEILDADARKRALAQVSIPAIVSLALGIFGCLYCIPGVAAIVLGSVASRQIQRSEGALKGDGLARWGIILGIFWVVAYFLLFIFIGIASR